MGKQDVRPHVLACPAHADYFAFTPPRPQMRSLHCRRGGVAEPKLDGIRILPLAGPARGAYASPVSDTFVTGKRLLRLRFPMRKFSFCFALVLLSLAAVPSHAQKICTKGKPCGNRCIAQNRTCHAGAGSARSAGGRATGQTAAPAVAASRPAFSGTCIVSTVYDGDTVTCRDGTKIRLLLVDTPEMGQRELGREARRALLDIMPLGTTVHVEHDIERTDRYGRTLAYLWLCDGRLVNEALARAGYAAVLSYPPNVRHIDRIRSAADEAKAARRGLWSRSAFEACNPRDYRAKRCGQ